MRRSVDPRTTEAFLLQQEGVRDASVWFGGERLHAHVTPVSHYAICEADLRAACARGLGEANVPESILVVPN